MNTHVPRNEAPSQNRDSIFRLGPNRPVMLGLILASLATSAVGQVSLTTLGTPHTQNFNTLAVSGDANPWADNSTLPGWYAQFSVVPANPTTYRADNNGTGGLRSMGVDQAAERALGSSSSATPGTIYFAVHLVNNTGLTIDSLAISYTGEQWRNGGNTSAQTLAFEYRVVSAGVVTDANTPSTGWLSLSTLDFVSPVTGATAVQLDGNLTANRVAKSATLAVTVNVGQEVWLRWKDIDDGGNDHTLAIDDLSVTPSARPQTLIDAAQAGSTIVIPAGTYGGITIDKSLNLVAGGPVIISGASPALTVSAGVVSVSGFTFTTATADPTVLVNGTGSLKMRNCVVQESTSHDRQAVKVVGATASADLGTVGDLGGNTFNLNSPGTFVESGNNAIPALGNTWKDNGTDITGQNFDIEDSVYHSLDASGAGLVTWVANNLYVTPLTQGIQRGLNASASGFTVNVEAGTYEELLLVDHPVNLVGPHAANCPGTSLDRVGEAIITPPDLTLGIGDVLIHVTSDNVSIKGFTLEGDNPANTLSATTGNGDVLNLVANGSFDDGTGYPFVFIKALTVENNILRHAYDVGVQLWNDGAAPVSIDNVIRCNRFADFAGLNSYSPGGPYSRIAILIYNDTYAQVDNNVVTSVRIGYQDGNNFRANTGASFSVSGNSIAAERIGIWHNLHYVGADTLTISGNTLSVIDEAGTTRWDAIFISSIQSAVNVVVANNTINGSDVTQPAVGYQLWNLPTTASITISGGTVSDCDYGVWINNYAGYSSDGDSSSVIVNAVTITGSRAAGVRVQDDPLNTAFPLAVVNATVTGNSSITGAGSVGVLVEGGGASASVINNPASITGNAYGVDVDAGKALIQNNNLTGNSSAAIRARNSATVDAGDCAAANVTGLGSSSGANILSGYGADNAAPWAVENLNSSAQPAVWAQNNNYGIVAGQSVEDVIYDDTDTTGANSVVHYSQAPIVVTGPGPVTVQCVADVAGVPSAVTLAQFILLGGTVSADSVASVSFADGPLTPGPAEGTITRTYTIVDSCGQSASVAQVITVDDTIPPVIAVCPANIAVPDPGNDGEIVTFATPSATDNCGVTVVCSPASSTLFLPGPTTVTCTATDGGGLTDSCAFLVVVCGGTPAVTYVDDGYTDNLIGDLVNFPDNGAPGPYVVGCNAFASVQGGINAVAASGTVNVAAGTYAEAVNANKSVTLLGANAGTSGNAPRGAESIINGGAGIAIDVTASGVTVDGFGLSGVTGLRSQLQTGTAVRNNVILGGALGVNVVGAVTPLEIRDNAVTVAVQEISGTPTVGISLSGVSGGAAATVQNNNITGSLYGYVLYAIGTTPATTVTGGTIKNVMQGVAIVNTVGGGIFAPSIVNLLGITMSSFTGTSVVGARNFHAGVYIFTGGADNTKNITSTISVDVTGTGNPQSDSAGLYFADFSAGAGVRQNVQVENCSIVNNRNRGVYATGANALVNIDQCYITGNGFDPVGTGGNDGFGVISRAGATVTVTESYIHNPSTVTVPYLVHAITVDAGHLTVIGCSIENSGNANGKLATASGSINASGNWWGNNALAVITPLITGVVDYTPILTAGTDTSVTTGFQGDFDTLIVHTLNAQTGAGGRIQEGIDLTTTLGTVKIAAGSYTEMPNTSLKSVALVLGASPGLVTLNGDLTLDGDDTLTFDELNGTMPGVDQDQIVVNGFVSLGGANLVASAALLSDCTSLVLIANDSADNVNGAFVGLPNSALVTISGQGFRIFYDRGDGNDVVLVKDTMAPVIACGSVPAQTANTDALCGALVPDVTALVRAASTDACTLNANLAVAQNPLAGSLVTGAGAYSITVTVTDEVGNSDVCVVPFSVSDVTAPVVACGSVPAQSADADASCNALVPDVRALVRAQSSDNCTAPAALIITQTPAEGSTVSGTGSHPITVSVTDAAGNSAVACVVAFTVIDVTPPTIVCPADVAVNSNQPRDPYATGSATGSDNCGPVTITYNDDRSGLTGCNASGVIFRTWTATDVAGSTATCQQTITVVDNISPLFTACPAPSITTANAPGLCSATVNFTTTAKDVSYNQGFENAAFLSGPAVITPSTDWNDYGSHLARVPSLTGGITSRSGVAHAVIDSTVLPPSPDDFTGAFTRLGGYSAVFGTGFRTSVDVYLNLSDPAVVADTYGWDVSTAANNQSGGHRRDFIFHAASDALGNILIGADNNSSFTRRNDLGTLANHLVVSASGWYTFEWVFRDSAGVLAVDMQVRDSGGALLFTETRSDASDLIATVVGGNRYMWFTFLEVDTLAIDNTVLERNVSVNCTFASGSSFFVGTTPVVCTAIDACNNSAICSFNVIVNDDERPVITSVPSGINYGCNPPLRRGDADVQALVTATDNCGTPLVTVTHVDSGTPCAMVRTFTVSATDASGNVVLTPSTVVDTWTDDLIPPTVTSVPPGINYGCNPLARRGDTDVLALVTAADNCGVPLVTVTHVDGGTPCAMLRTFTITATDACGNLVAAPSVVVDTWTDDLVLPTITTCPTSFTVYATNMPANCETNISFTVAAADNCPGVTVICSPPSGSGFPLGTTTVNCHAVDACGNQSAGAPSTCTFSVTVIDVSGDVAVACWRGNSMSTRQQWTFDSSASPASPTSYLLNAAGSPSAVISIDPFGFGGGWIDLAPSSFGCFQGAWSLGTADTITLTIPNHPPSLTAKYKYVRVQVTAFRLLPVSDVPTVSVPGAVSVGSPAITVLKSGQGSLPGGQWIVESTLWRFPNCPNSETVVLTAPDDGVIIDQVVVDTLCLDFQCPSDIVDVADPGQCSKASVSWNAPVAGPCEIAGVVCVPPSGSTFPVGTLQPVTCTVTDVEGGTYACAFTVTINDTQAPVITCPLPVTVACAGMVPPANFSGGSVTDNCPGVVNVTHVGDAISGMTCANRFVITRTYKATDVHNNSSLCTQTITVDDQTAPVITTVAGNLDRTLECNDAAGIASALLLLPAATDNCGGLPLIQLVSDSSTTDPMCPNGYVQVRTWNFIDECGNISANFVQTITVRDTTPPVLAGVPPAIASYQCYADVPPSPSVTVADNCDMTVTVNFTETQSSPGSSCNNVITRTWSAADSCGNPVSFTQTISVNDTLAPTATQGAIASCYQTVAAANAAALAATTALTDNCDPAPTKAVFTSAAVDCATAVIIRVSDSCGNFTDYTYPTRVDNIAPTATQGAIASCYLTVADANAAALAATTALTDNCDPAPTKAVFTSAAVDCATAVIIRVSDSCGNFTDYTYPMRVDNTAPVIASTAATQNAGALNVKNGANEALQGLVTITVVASDDCGLSGVPTLQLVNGMNTVTLTGTQGPPGTFTYGWTVDCLTANGIWTATVTASDGCTSVPASFTITVNTLQIAGQLQLQDFLGTCPAALPRTVTFKATDSMGVVIKTWTLPVVNGPGGTYGYTLIGVPAATVNLSAKTAWTLRRRLPVSFTGCGSTVDFTGATGQLKGGDITGDNRVQVSDYSALASNFGKCAYLTCNSCGGAVTPGASVADINGDGVVNAFDYSILASNWFTAGDLE